MDPRGPEAREPRKKLILLCDGTWFAIEAGTKTNIHLLAEMVGMDKGPELHTWNTDKDPEPNTWNTDTIKARYAEGVRSGGTFLDYIFEGATGRLIDKECTSAYQYIVENYTPQFEIWMFGLSRGAFIVRSVAGMINNCGIIRLTCNEHGDIDYTITTMRCQGVYEKYCNPDKWAHPQLNEMKEYRRKNSHDVRTPVKFMGLFDTVGGLGTPIPMVYGRSGGEGVVTSEASYDNNVLGFTSHGFYNTTISSVVEKVYHALSLHDRLYMFAPCLVNRSVGSRTDPSFKIHQKWFPGTHYDLCRQEFKFFRAGTSFFEIAAATPLNLLSGTVRPNTVLSDLVLKWMLESIRHEDPDRLVIPEIDEQIQIVIDRIQRGQDVGSGDVYDDLLQYVPFRRVAHIAYWFWSYIIVGFLPSFARRITERIKAFSEINLIKRIISCKERLVTGWKADVYHYKDPDPSLGGKCIRDLARINRDRYPSETYEKFLVNELDMGLVMDEVFKARFEEYGGDWKLDIGAGHYWRAGTEI